jgi:hypothetical protein
MSEQRLHVRCTHWQPLRRGSLLGYASIELTAYGVILNSVPVFSAADGGLRAGVPTHPLLGTDGTVLMKGGKPARLPALAFVNVETRERFLRATAAALHAKFPTGLPVAGETAP